MGICLIKYLKLKYIIDSNNYTSNEMFEMVFREFYRREKIVIKPMCPKLIKRYGDEEQINVAINGLVLLGFIEVNNYFDDAKSGNITDEGRFYYKNL